MVLIGVLVEILDSHTIGRAYMEMFFILGPVWIAFVVGIVVGWAWKPRWAILDCGRKFKFSSPSSHSSVISSSAEDIGDGPEEQISISHTEKAILNTLQLKSEEGLVVTAADLGHLVHLVERKDGGSPWKHVMDRSTPNMSYQAWQRDPESGPPQHCCRSVYEDATPELLRDFFWDDEFRLKWDDMIVSANTIQECPITGTMVAHWVRKFPFFCSDREYIIGRRIWESGRSYYCVTKSVQNDSIPRRDKPRRVDLYYSSWFIRAVESRNRRGELSACEVVLFHHEDMGIPWEIAKFGVRQGMWGTVKKIERGFRAYQIERSCTGPTPVSRCAFLASVNTKVNLDYLESLEEDEDPGYTRIEHLPDKPGGLNIRKVLVLGGAVALAVSLNRGLLTKALIFGIARRFGNVGRRL